MTAGRRTSTHAADHHDSAVPVSSAVPAGLLWVVVGAGLAYGVVETVVKVAALLG